MFALARRDFPSFQQWRLENDREEARRLAVPAFLDDLVKALAELRFPRGYDRQSVADFSSRKRQLISDGMPYDAGATEILLHEALGGPPARTMLQDHISTRVGWHRLQLVADLGDDLALSTDALNGILISAERKAAHRSGDTYPALLGRSAEQNGPAPIGPRDSRDSLDETGEWLDYGALRVPVLNDLKMGISRVPSGEFGELQAWQSDMELRMQLFAASGPDGDWDSVRAEISAAAGMSEGAIAEEILSRFGTELWVQQVVSEAAGGPQVACARVLACDGQGWMLKCTFTGPDAFEPRSAALLEELYERTVVVRGDEAMEARKLIPLRMPSA